MTDKQNEPKLAVVSNVWICDSCLDGKGGECHTPGCIFWFNRAPDLAIRHHILARGGIIEYPLED